MVNLPLLPGLSSWSGPDPTAGAVGYHPPPLPGLKIETMKCAICGSELKETSTDLPFKVRASTIVILKDLSVLQCEGCREYLLRDGVVSNVDEI